MDSASDEMLQPCGNDMKGNEHDNKMPKMCYDMQDVASKHKHSNLSSIPFSGSIDHAESSNPREHLLHQIGHQHLLESGGWADRSSPGTNEMRRLRKLGADFDQYSRSRRKVVIVTFAMAAAFSLISVASRELSKASCLMHSL